MTSLSKLLSATLRDAPAAPVALSPPVPLGSLPTPALVVDLDRFETNLARMQRHVDVNGLGLRPHAKMHKCPEIAKRQIAQGARGVCTATISEAEVMAQHGIGDILITSPVVSEDKIERLMQLLPHQPQLCIVVDHAAGADLLQRAAARCAVSLGVVIDLDPGLGRTGIAPPRALGLARHILEHCPALTFSGLQMYAGECMHIEDFDQRRARYGAVMRQAIETRAAFENAGIEVPMVTGGGTGSYDMEPALGALTEIQAGSYLFMDVEYRDIGSAGGPRFEDFAPALFVLVTAISQPQAGRITVDGGFKAFAADSVVPQARDLPGARYRWAGDEHGILELADARGAVRLGDKLPMLVSHCDPTVNLYNYYYVCRNGLAEALWPITARGCSQ